MSWWVRNLNPPSHVRDSEKIKLSGETGMPNLPEELINDILLRLPVKSLLRFRCVSKSWRSLISDPKFIRKHLYISTSDGNYTNYRYITLCYKNLDTIIKSYSLHTIFNEPFLDHIELTYPYGRERQGLIVGTCNGLICCQEFNSEFIFLWNPSTRESRRLQGHGFKFGYDAKAYPIYGFGYDYIIDDYKVVVIICSCYRHGHINGKVLVYTLRTDSWREIIERYPSELSKPRDKAIFLGGALNWHVEETHNSHVKRLTIVAFDLANETFQMLSHPTIEDRYYENLSLGVLGECLCVIANYKGIHAGAVVWVMKEYGDLESWTKLMTVPYAEGLCSSSKDFYIPIWFWKNGQILLELYPNLIIYNSKDNTIIKFQPIFMANAKIPCVYIESLVSLAINADEHLDERQRLSLEEERLSHHCFEGFRHLMCNLE